MSTADQFTDLKTRFISAVILVLVAFFCVWYGSLFMLLMMSAFAYIGLKEWMDLPKSRNYSDSTKRKWFGFGLLYVGWACVSILLIRYSENSSAYPDIDLGFVASCWIISIAMASDVGAYFAGRFVGGPKVAPAISPNKTWAGVVGGVVVSILFTSIVLFLLDFPVNSSIIKLVIVFSLIGQVGDFFESYVKRRFKVKDTGSFLPGHGGLLDRMDGQIFIMIAAGVFAFFAGPMDQMAVSLLVW